MGRSLTRRDPIAAGGRPASELIIAERRRGAMSRQPGQTATSYLDSSALVKRYLVETGTPWVQTWCDDPVQTVAVLDISHYAYLCECEIATAWAQARGDLAAGRYRAESADTHTARIHTERTGAP